DIPNLNNILQGNHFASSLKRIGHFQFPKLNLNKSTQQIQIHLKPPLPHNYFHTTYPTIKLQNTPPKLIYNKHIYPNKHQNPQSQKFPLKLPHYIHLTHLQRLHTPTLTNLHNTKQQTFRKKLI
ncbi:putative mucin/carbohydrate-binding domain-containing protein, partial [Bacillus thuringiensis]|uniref:putative mucin/carbohydrate-binding domain-containing protein n=1 Tax=Bacillus thuringiensis TaxID=1428 RepID=UPI0024144490